MNKGNNGKYPEKILFFLFAIAFTVYWLTTAYKGGVPVILFIPVILNLPVLAVNFINSLKNADNKTGGKDEKWEKTYSGDDKVVYQKDNMTFRMNGNPLLIIAVGLYPVIVVFKKLKNGSLGTRYTPFLIFLIAVTAVISIFSAITVAKERKARKLEWLINNSENYEDNSDFSEKDL